MIMGFDISWFLLALISALFSAAASIGEKKSLFTEQALVFCVILSFFNVICSIPLIFLSDVGGDAGPGQVALFIKSVLNVCAFFCVMQAIKRLELSYALPLLVLTPGLVALAAWMFLAEDLNGHQIAGLILLMAGAFLLELRRRIGFLDIFTTVVRSPGRGYILAALLIFTITSVLDKAILKQWSVEPVSFVIFSHLYSLVVFGFVFLLSRNDTATLMISLKRSGRLIFLIAICTVIYRYTQISAVKIAPVALVLAVKRFSVIFGVVLGGRLFSEASLARKSFAAALMLIGAYLVSQVVLA
jgi:drug/metabolite transporter (DMT)-like permease